MTEGKAEATSTRGLYAGLMERTYQTLVAEVRGAPWQSLHWSKVQALQSLEPYRELLKKKASELKLEQTEPVGDQP
jgi:hypothetical protein